MSTTRLTKCIRGGIGLHYKTGMQGNEHIYGAKSKFRCNVFISQFLTLWETLYNFFKTADGHLIVRKNGIENIFLIYYLK